MDEKRKKHGGQSATQSVSTKEEVEKLLSEFKKKLKIKEEEVIANANLRAQGLLNKSTNS